MQLQGMSMCKSCLSYLFPQYEKIILTLTCPIDKAITDVVAGGVSGSSESAPRTTSAREPGAAGAGRENHGNTIMNAYQQSLENWKKAQQLHHNVRNWQNMQHQQRYQPGMLCKLQSHANRSQIATHCTFQQQDAVHRHFFNNLFQISSNVFMCMYAKN